MKKLQILLPMAAVLLSLTGCKKDNEKSGPSGETVTLSATLGGGEKTEINGFSMTWSDGDAVNINGTPYTATFPFDDGTYTQASFVGVERAKDGKYEAYYPASLYDKDNDKYVLSSTQTYHPENGNKLSNISPMYAVTENTELQFHNICALVKLQVKGEGTVSKIVVSSDDNLCGTFTVSGDGGKYRAVISPSEGGKTLILNCGAVVDLKENEATTFYIALPQGELRNLTFKIGESTSDAVNANLTAGKLYTKTLEYVEVPVIEFTVGMDDDIPRKVKFAPGNLQATYNGSKYTWAFAENQYDYVGNAAGNTTIDNQQNGAKVDLFGWTKAGLYSDGIKQYGINTSKANSDYGSAAGDACCDWGSLIGAGWRTLTSSEWTYLFNTRATSSGVRYAKATVNGVAGVILVPDNWNNTSTYSLQSTNTTDAAFTVNTIDKTDWENTLEPAGCVFLPAAGCRFGTSVGNVGSDGLYWSSTPFGAPYAYYLYFSSGYVNPANGYFRYYGYSVRLVLSVEN